VGINKNHPRWQQLLCDFIFPTPGGSQVAQNYQQPDFSGNQYQWLQTIGNSTILWILAPPPGAGWAAGVNIQGVYGDRLSTSSGATADMRAPFTMQCVVMSPNPSGTANIQTAVSKESNASSYGTMFLQWQHTTPAASNAWRADLGSGSFVTLQVAPFAANTWYDLCVTVDAAGNWLAYRNGTLEATGNGIGVPAHGTNQFLIGYQGNLGDTGLINIWAGYCSVLRAWNRVLRGNEIRDLHARPFEHYALN
jgi:hypothetical protein